MFVQNAQRVVGTPQRFQVRLVGDGATDQSLDRHTEATASELNRSRSPVKLPFLA